MIIDIIWWCVYGIAFAVGCMIGISIWKRIRYAIQLDREDIIFKSYQKRQL
jgi:hypothetical protein